MKSKSQPGVLLLSALIVLTALQGMAILPMLAVVWFSTAAFGPAGSYSPSNPWLTVGKAVAPLPLMFLLLAAAWLLWAVRWPRSSLLLAATGLAVPLVEAFVICTILFSSP